MSRICDINPFVSQVTPQDPPTANSIELLKQEIESYLRRLQKALCEDFTDLELRLDALEERVTACCGSS